MKMNEGYGGTCPFMVLFLTSVISLSQEEQGIYPVLCIRKYITTSREDTVSFDPVTFTDTGRKATLMAEFKLTDNPQELAEGQKEKRLAVPSTQDNRSAGTITTSVPEVPTDDNHLFQVVECMPEFPRRNERMYGFHTERNALS